MQQIADWLSRLGLGQYAQRFADNDIDASILRDLTNEDLEKIGVSLGHRKRMLRAIAELDEAPCALGSCKTRRADRSPTQAGFRALAAYGYSHPRSPNAARSTPGGAYHPPER